MNSFKIILLFAICDWQLVKGQGTFQNLDFESANVPSILPGQTSFLPFTNAFPGWVGYIGDTNVATTALYNGVSVGSPLISLIGPNTEFYSNNVISGNFSAALSAGNLPPNPPHIPAAIAQIGVVPSVARSLTFAAQPLAGNIGDLLLTFNGQSVPFVPLSIGSNYSLYGADIASFAGQSVELRFTERAISTDFPTTFIDNIAFSDLAVPEPTFLGLFCIGAALTGHGLAQQKRRR